MKIIGLGYKAKSGKDTVAKILEEDYGYSHFAFADSMKEAARAIFSLTYEQTNGRLKEEMDHFWNMTPRKILQLLGNEAMKPPFGKDVWVRAMSRKLRRYDKENVVLSDVRFLAEAHAIKEWGGLLVRIDRKGAEASNGVDKHASEFELESYRGWDYVIDNNGSLEDLDKAVARIVV